MELAEAAAVFRPLPAAIHVASLEYMRRADGEPACPIITPHAEAVAALACANLVILATPVVASGWDPAAVLQACVEFAVEPAVPVVLPLARSEAGGNIALGMKGTIA